MGAVTDDHKAFIDAGLPYIDLIGLPYAYWHRLGDLPAQCDPMVLASLGEVLIEFLRREIDLLGPP